MNELKYAVQKLGDNNYPVWKFRMELVLIHEKLMEVVNSPKPEEPDNAWKVKDGKARAIIGLSLEDGQLCHVIRAETAKDMWDGLVRYHERSSLSSKVHVLRKLCSQRLQEGGSMSDHLNQVTVLTNRLTAMGEELKEHLVVAMLFSSLPESYGGLVTALESRDEKDLTLEFVKGKLLDEWRRREEREVAEKVLRAGSETAGPSSEKPKVKCWYCQEEGHIRSDCEKLAEDKQKKSAQQVRLATDNDVCLAVLNDRAEGGLWVLEEREVAGEKLRAGSEPSRPSSGRPKLTRHYCLEEGHYRRECAKLAEDIVLVDQKNPGQKVKLVTNKEVCLAVGSDQADVRHWVLEEREVAEAELRAGSGPARPSSGKSKLTCLEDGQYPRECAERAVVVDWEKPERTNRRITVKGERRMATKVDEGEYSWSWRSKGGSRVHAESNEEGSEAGTNEMTTGRQWRIAWGLTIQEELESQEANALCSTNVQAAEDV